MRRQIQIAGLVACLALVCGSWPSRALAAGMDVVKEAQSRMERAVEDFRRRSAGVRNKTASPALLDDVKVDVYGTMQPLSQSANIAIPDRATMVVQPYDKGMLPSIEKAIRAAGLNPENDGKAIKIVIPAPTDEQRKEVLKKADTLADELRSTIRQAHQDGIERLKKLAKVREITDEDEKRGTAELQKQMDRHLANVNELMKGKEHEILKE